MPPVNGQSAGHLINSQSELESFVDVPEKGSSKAYKRFTKFKALNSAIASITSSTNSKIQQPQLPMLKRDSSSNADFARSVSFATTMTSINTSETNL